MPAASSSRALLFSPAPSLPPSTAVPMTSLGLARARVRRYPLSSWLRRLNLCNGSAPPPLPPRPRPRRRRQGGVNSLCNLSRLALVRAGAAKFESALSAIPHRRVARRSTVTHRCTPAPSAWSSQTRSGSIFSFSMEFQFNGGKCLQQSILPASFEELRRFRCRIAFRALKFRPEIHTPGSQIVGRLRACGPPYLAYHPGTAMS